MSWRSIGALVVASGLVSVLPAQDVIGPGVAGSGGFVPALSAKQAWMGNANWGLDVSNAVGGASGILAVSAGQITFSTGSGLPIYLDPAQVLFTLPFAAGGLPGSNAAGTAFVPVPLSFGVIPYLAGFVAYWQAAVTDPSVAGGVTVTNGLSVELTMPPQIFVGSSVGGSADPFAIVDPLSWSPSVPATLSTYTNNVNGVVYTDGGREMYVCSGFGVLNHADLSTGTPVWSTLYNFSGSSGVAEGNLQLDEARKLLWAIGDIGSTGGLEFVAFDVDHASPTYGQIRYYSNGLYVNGLIGVWGLSPSGNLAALPSLIGGSLTVWDLDPASPTFLTPLLSRVIPSSAISGLWINTDVAFSNDEDIVSVLRQGAGTTPAELARFRISTTSWIDHNPGLGGVQNIGSNASPPALFGSAPTHLNVARRGGNFLVVSGFGGSGWAGRIDIDPVNVNVFSYTPITAVGLPNAWRNAISPDGDLIAVGSYSPLTLHVFNAQTLALVASVPLPGGATVSDIAWK